jgi:hypothetical protein
MWRVPQSAARVASATTRLGATLVLGVAGEMEGGWPPKKRKLQNEPIFLHAGLIFFGFVLANEAISVGVSWSGCRENIIAACRSAGAALGFSPQ